MAERKNKKRLWLIILTALLLSAGLFRLLISSYVICNYYLPVLSDLLDVKISAREVDWHLTRRTITFRDLRLALPNDTLFSAKRMITAVSYREALNGILSLEKIHVRDAELYLSDLTTSSAKRLRNADRLRIGPQDIHNLTVRYTRKNSGTFFRLAIDRLHGDAVIPEQTTGLKVHSGIVWKTDNVAMQLPLNGDIRYRVDSSFSPLQMQAVLETEEPDVNIYKTVLPGFRLKSEWDVHRETDGTIQLKQCQISIFANAQRMFFAQLHGDYRNSAFHLNLSAETNDAAAVANNFLPLPLEQIPLSANLKASLSRQDNCFSLDNFFWQIRQKEKTVLEAETTGKLAVCYNADKSWSLEKSPASLSLKTEEFPLTVFNNFVPFQIHTGTLSAGYLLHIDPEKKCLTGSFSGLFKDLELYRNNSLFFRRHTADVNCTFNSDGLVNLKKIRIPDFSITSTGSKGVFASMKLAGHCDFITHTIALSGTADTLLPKLLHKIAWKPVQILSQELDESRNLSYIDLKVDLPANTISYQAKSETKTPELPAPLQMESKGKLKLHPGSQQFLLDHFALSVPEHFLLTMTGNAAFSSGQYTAGIKVQKVSPELIRNLWTAAEPDDPYDLELIRKLHFRNITANMVLSYQDKDDRFLAKSADFMFTYAPGQSVKVHLTAPLEGNLKTMKFQDGTGELHFADFPMSFCNLFIPDYMRYKFTGGIINGTADLHFINPPEKIGFDASLFIDDLRAKKRNIELPCGSCTITGKGSFNKFFTNFEYHDGVGRIIRNGEPILEVNSNGTLDMFAPYKADFYFKTPNITKQYMELLCSGFCYRDFNANGSFSVHCINNYRDLTLKMEQNILKAVPVYPENSVIQEPELHGKLRLNYDIHGKEKLLTWNDSSLILKNSDEKTVLHFAMDGSWKQNPERNVSSCILRSDAADLQMLTLAVKGAKEQRKDNAEMADSKTDTDTADRKQIQKWNMPDQEPDALDFADFATKLQVILRNWTYSDLLNAELDAEFTAENNTFSAKNISGKLNDGTFQFHANANTGVSDGWELNADGTLKKLDIAPLIECFASDSLKEKKILGTIDMLRLTAETKGITPASLDNSLKINGCAEVSNVSFPLTSAESVSVLKLLVLPVVLLPRIVEVIPEENTRNALKQSIIGDAVDILSGKRNLELSRGQVRIHSSQNRGTDLVFDKFLFVGPAAQLRTKSMTVNPVHNEVSAETETFFAGLLYPLNLSGKLDHPNIDYSAVLLNLLTPRQFLRLLVPGVHLRRPEWKFEENLNLK